VLWNVGGSEIIDDGIEDAIIGVGVFIEVVIGLYFLVYVVPFDCVEVASLLLYVKYLHHVFHGAKAVFVFCDMVRIS
jgi:hypothetical protein